MKDDGVCLSTYLCFLFSCLLFICICSDDDSGEMTKNGDFGFIKRRMLIAGLGLGLSIYSSSRYSAGSKCCVCVFFFYLLDIVIVMFTFNCLRL